MGTRLRRAVEVLLRIMWGGDLLRPLTRAAERGGAEPRPLEEGKEDQDRNG